MYEEYIREVKDPEKLLGEDCGYCFLDFCGQERADTFIVERYENGIYYGTSTYLEQIEVRPEQIRRFYHVVHSITEMLNTSTTTNEAV